jgi:hypothetical protein
MHGFLYEVVARIVAVYLAYDCALELRNGFVQRKIRYYNPDLLNWYSYGKVDRDTAPIRYWIEIVTRVSILLACIVVAIFGWFHPNS